MISYVSEFCIRREDEDPFAVAFRGFFGGIDPGVLQEDIFVKIEKDLPYYIFCIV